MPTSPLCPESNHFANQESLPRGLRAQYWGHQYPKQQVKQVRRLESLFRRLQKWEALENQTMKTWNELLLEWNAVHTSKAFGPDFLTWMLSFVDTEFPSWPLSSATWTFEAFQLAKHHLNISLAKDETRQAQRATYLRQLDAGNSNRQAFAQVRGAGPPPVNEVQREVAFEAIAISADNGLTHELYADTSVLQLLSVSSAILVDSRPLTLQEIHSHHVVAASTQPCAFPETVHVSQHHYVMHPADIAKALDSYWLSLWQRDDDDDDTSFLHQSATQLGFQEFFASLPTLVDFKYDPTNLDAWQNAIRKLKAGSARGTDKNQCTGT